MFTLLCSKFNPFNLICFPTLNDLLQVMNTGLLWLLQCPPWIVLHIDLDSLFNGEFSIVLWQPFHRQMRFPCNLTYFHQSSLIILFIITLTHKNLFSFVPPPQN